MREWTMSMTLVLCILAAVPPAKAETLDCKDPILNQPAFQLQLDPQASTVTFEALPASYIAPGELHTSSLRQSNGTLKWSLPQPPSTLEFALDPKTGAVTVDRLLAGQHENYGSFSCAKAINSRT
jgi:hypothetical protein